MNLNDPILSCPLDATEASTLDLKDFHGKWLIVYFYPKDSTPGCTVESQNFRDKHADFLKLNAIVVGVSRDSVASHEKFKEAQQLPFALLSDNNEALCKQFDVIKMKSMYGKQVRGIERSTFIINPEGRVCHEWRKVSVPGHVDEVYQTLLSLQR